VRYDAPGFRVLHTQHFDVYYEPLAREGAVQAARLAERWYARLSAFFVHELRGRQPLILYRSPAAFRQTNVVEGDLGEGTGGVTESLRRRIVLPLAGSLSATDHVIGHELVHAFQFDLTARLQPASEGRAPGAERLPLWFVEGMAEYLSRGPLDAETALWLRDAVANEALPSVANLGDPKYFPYRWGHALWAYIAGRWGDRVLVPALVEAGRSGRADTALAATLGTTVADLSRNWHAAVVAWAEALPPGTRPSASGQLVAVSRGAFGLDAAPALSPDGRWLAVLSARDLLSVDLFLVDAADRRVVTRVASTAREAHLTSLQYIASAGAWDATSRYLAFASRRGPRPTIERYDLATRRRLPPVVPTGVDEVLNPAWSPDGRRLAFVGMRHGRTDLFVTEVASGETQQLTDDAWAELHPVFTPDGDGLVVATDRYTSDQQAGRAGAWQLATVSPASRAVTRLGSFEGAMLSPQWGDIEGRTLYFVGERGGRPNVWRLDLASGSVVQITDLAVGVTGITPTSPAISVAPSASRLAFSTVDDGRLRVYLQASGQPVQASPGGGEAVVSSLPPAKREAGDVARYLADAGTGLPLSADFPDTPYRARLALDAVVQPSVGVAVDRFGTYGAGQIALLWGDMLGDRTLVTAFQANATLDSTFSYRDLGSLVGYSDRSRRWQWAVTAEQTPYRSGSVQAGTGSLDGRPALVTQEVVDRLSVQGLSGVAAYPVSDARRVEVGLGVQRYSFTEHLRTLFTVDGRTVADERRRLELPGFAQTRGMAAYVFDRASFGATSPLLGARTRLEVAPTAGAVRYTGLLADYRRYLMPLPFYTIAGRLLHYGRYGAGADDRRLSPLFLGYPELVRGYDVGSFRADECAAEECPVFERLVGSRLLVANAELRFPLLRPFGLGSAMYGPLPVELALFGDAGVAWGRGTAPAHLGGQRSWVSSAGVTARANAFGIAVVQVSAARPFQRPGRGWIVQVSLTPGF